MSALPILVLLLLAAAAILWWRSRSLRRTAGLPGGRVIYTDTRRWGKVEEPLYDAELGLTGRPDYLLEQGGRLIPVEVKSGRIPDGPYDSHIYQLAAYCLLVSNIYDNRPPYGILHYTSATGASRTYAIDFTSELEQTLLDLLDEMRSQERRKEVPRSHEQPARCKGCGFRSLCDQRLS